MAGTGTVLKYDVEHSSDVDHLFFQGDYNFSGTNCE
jgi:hypothetical protein